MNYGLFKRMGDQYLNQGNREVLTLQVQASYENAFFIIPEPRINIKKLLHVHTSVNVMNSFLPEISHMHYGKSKERQKKIEGVLKEMISFINEDDALALDDEDDYQQLDSPFSLVVNDKFDAIEKKRMQKQKIMRELRVVEQCVDILHTPFATGNFNFKNIN